jgi:hypothetical protein
VLLPVVPTNTTCTAAKLDYHLAKELWKFFLPVTEKNKMWLTQQ